MDIKAIDTVYDGHKFRSRLEARWAVFFKERGGFCSDYGYEVEGFEMPNGMKYLPDFSFTDCYGRITYYAEVKPEKFTKEDIVKPWLFSLYSNVSVILLYGEPRIARFPIIFSFDYMMDSECEYGFSVTNDDKDALKKAKEARFEFGETPQ